MTVDRIVSSNPVNKTAARVLGKGLHWQPARKIEPWRVWQDMPLPLQPYPPDAPFPVGHKCGRLTVIGKAEGKKSPGRWVVKCTCGKYGHRTARSLRPDKADRAMCHDCDYLDQMKRGNVPAAPMTVGNKS